MPTKSALQDEWERYKDDILNIYLHNDKSLSEVMTTMKRRGFCKTKSQYERTFKKWGVSKNIKEEEWKFIVDRLHDRETMGKLTNVRVRGMLVPTRKIQKQRRVYEYKPTYEQFQSKFHIPQRPITPDGVEMLTPIGSPISRPDPEEALMDCLMQTQISACLTKTPWAMFQVISFGQPFARWEWSLTNIPDRAQPQASPNQILAPSVESQVPSKVRSDYLPITGAEIPPYHFDHTIRDGHETQAEQIVKSLVGAISNNFDVHTSALMIVDLARNAHFRAALQPLFVRRLETVSAVAEKLLLPAVKEGNFELVKLLIESNVNIDQRAHSSGDRSGETITALQCAVEQMDLRMVDYLLEKNAMDWTTHTLQRPGDGYRIRTTSALDLAAGMDCHDIFKRLLQHVDGKSDQLPQPTMTILHHAVLSGQTSNVELILRTQPRLLYIARATPWFFFEAAAVCKTQSSQMIGLLINHGLDVAATDSCGRGSMLAAACIAPNMEVVSDLLADSSNINIEAVGLHSSHVSEVCHLCRNYGMESIRGKSALHVAIAQGHEELVSILIKHGANVHQSCELLLPIQTAASQYERFHDLRRKLGEKITEKMEGKIYREAEKERDNKIVNVIKILMAAGADINSVGTTFPASITASASELTANMTALRLALLCRFVGVAEFLYIAGGVIFPCTMGIPSPEDWDNVWEGILRQGSCTFVLSTIQQWNHAFSQQRRSSRFGDCVARLGVVVLETLQDKGIVARDATTYFAVISAAIRAGSYHVARDALNLWKENLGALPRLYATGALTLAANYGKADMIQMLLCTGADPYHIISTIEARDLERINFDFHLWPVLKSAFLHSLMSGNFAIAEMFLSMDDGMKFHKRPLSQQQQLCEAYAESLLGGFAFLERLLVDHGVTTVEINRVMGPEYLPRTLYRAITDRIPPPTGLNWFDEVERLLRLGARPVGINFGSPRSWHTALQVIASGGKTRLFKKILVAGDDVHAPPSEEHGATALQYAAINGNFTIINMIMPLGVNVNADPGDYEGRSAIEGAAEHGRLDMVRYLLEAGADVRGRANRNYRRTVFRAWKEGHWTIVSMIQRWKTERYGEEDCERIEKIAQTMTDDELDFANEEARIRYRENGE